MHIYIHTVIDFEEGCRKSICGRLLVPDVTSMTKYLCSSHRLIIYSYLNQCLKDGSLAKTAKLDIRDGVVPERRTYP